MDFFSFNTLFNLFFASAAFATVALIHYVKNIIKQRNVLFTNANTTEGIVLSVSHKQSLSLPIIEYTYDNKTLQFTATVTAGSIKEGQSITLQIAPDGSARIKTPTSHFMLHILDASMFVFFILGCLFVYNKFFA